MKLQFNILVKIIKKIYYWFLAYYILIIGTAFARQLAVQRFNIIGEFEELIFMPKNISIINLFHIVFVVYLTYLFYTYEIKHSFCNVIMRIKDKQMIIGKIIFLNIIFFVLVTVRVIISYLFYKNDVTWNIIYLVSPYVYTLVMCYIVMCFVNAFKSQDVVSLALSLIFSYFIFMRTNLTITIIILIFLLLWNYCMFSFKRFFK